MQLRPYQDTLVNGIFDAWSRVWYVAAVLPTGGGKTVIYSHIVANDRTPSAVIAHRSELVGQTSLALVRNRVRHRIIGQKPLISWCHRQSIIECGHSYIDHNAPCAVISVDTLVRMNASDPWFRSVRLWVCDEAHHLQRDNKWGKAISMFPHARGLGVTATLERADGCGLGDPDGFLQEIVVGPSMRQLINDGYLSDFRVLAPPNDINLRDIPIGDSGDFSQAPLRRAVHNSHIVGDVVQHYLRFVPGKLGVTFCVDIESAAETCQAYRQAGVTAEVVTGKTPAEARANLMRRFGNGEFRQLCVVDVVSEGTDIPAIDCVSLARPSASYVTVAQQIGRALRPYPGKDKAVILDHVGNVARFARVGYCPTTQRSTIELDRATWSLARRERRRRNSPDDVQPIRVCPNCLADYPATEGRVCPYCSHYEPPAGRSTPDQVDGDLAELDPEALRQLANQVIRVDGAPVFPVGVAPGVQGAIAKRHRERQEAQGALRQAMMLWGGARLAEGMSLRQAQRVFFHTFGVDVMTAQTLGRPEAEELTPRVLHGLNSRETPR